MCALETTEAAKFIQMLVNIARTPLPLHCGYLPQLKIHAVKYEGVFGHISEIISCWY